MRIWSKSELTQFLMQETAYEPKGKASLKIEVETDGEFLWEFTCNRRHGKGQISILSKNLELRNIVIRSLDRIVATDLSITDIDNRVTRKTNQSGWEDWLLNNLVSPELSRPRYLIPDTNFILRRYASWLFRKIGAEKFKQLRFDIPNLVILEIEAIYNREKKKSENIKCENNARRDAFVKKGEALIATKELIFLRENGAYMLSSDIQGDIADKFAKIAGKGATDMFIRKEIRDNMLTSGESLFLTCDLMNALAATAEGISAFYFSRSNSEIGSLSSEHERCMEQLSELIVDTAIIFNEITIVKSLSLGKPKTMRFRGFWDNWGIEDLFHDKIAETS